MLTRKRIGAAKISAATMIASGLAVGLAACASEAPVLDPSHRPMIVPEQSVQEACALSQADIDAVTDRLKQGFDSFGKGILSGELPDFSALFAEVQQTIEHVDDGVINPRVRAALDAVGAQFAGFSRIAPPASVFAVPQYMGELSGQLGRLGDATKQLHALCSAS